MAKKTAKKAVEPVEEAPKLVEAPEGKAVEPTPEGEKIDTSGTPLFDKIAEDAPKVAESFEQSRNDPTPAVAQKDAQQAVTAAVEPSKAAEMLAEADEDDETMRAVKVAVSDAWESLRVRDDLAGKVGNMVYDHEFSDLSFGERLGLWSIALGIVNDPYKPTLGAIMADNNDRRSLRIVEAEIRRALGFAEVSHP